MTMKKLCVLVCPVDWGLGHASRCVPVIRAFLETGCRVVVGVSGPGAEMIIREFGISDSIETAGENGVDGQPDPDSLSGRHADSRQRGCESYGRQIPGNVRTEKKHCSDRLEIIPFPGFSVTSYRKFFFPGMLLRVPAFLKNISREKRVLKRLVERCSPDLIVSDNRYGLVNEKVTSVIITHQLRPSMPLLLRPLEGMVSRVIRRWAGAFDECWIPDCADDPAAGKLTAGHESLSGAFFTGWLSRFSPGSDRYSNQAVSPEPPGSGGSSGTFRYRFLFLLSGPEPHRTMLEDIIKTGIRDSSERALLVRGLPGSFPEREIAGNLEILAFLDSPRLRKAIEESEIVVCRSGYSSVMDLLVLGRTAVLVPTPGQTEQEYLGKWLASKGWFRVVRQSDFNLQKLIEQQKGGFTEGSEKKPDRGSGYSMAEWHKTTAIAHKLLLEKRVKNVLRKASDSPDRSKS